MAGSNLARTVSNTKSNTILYGSSEADYFFNYGNGSFVTIIGGAGADSIRNFARHASITGGAGDDIITSYSSGDYATIEGGKGNDNIFADGSYTTLKYDNGDGDDTISGLGYDDTIDLGQNSYTSIQSDNDIKITVGEGSILLKDGYGKNIKIHSTAGTTERKFSNYESSKVIFGTNEADTILNGASAVSATIIGGEGVDSISNFANKAYLFGGDGNDKILSHSSTFAVTINGGAGDDSVDATGVNKTFVYTAGDGNDTVFGVGYGDVFDLGGSTYSTVQSGNDIKIIVGEGSILAKNAVGQNFTIQNLSATTESLSDWAGIFYFGKNDGSLAIDTSSNDVINLYDVSIDDIISLNTENNQITIGLNTGANLQIQSLENVSAKITMTEGSVNFNHSTGQWQLV